MSGKFIRLSRHAALWPTRCSAEAAPTHHKNRRYIRVADPAPASVYQSERYGDFTCTIPNLVAGDSYTVRLHFAEVYFTKAGQRLFNVSINGQQVLNSFDICAAAGGACKAIAEPFSAIADAKGTIVIGLTGVTDHAKVNGIDIVPMATSPAAPVVATNRPIRASPPPK